MDPTIYDQRDVVIDVEELYPVTSYMKYKLIYRENSKIGNCPPPANLYYSTYELAGGGQFHIIELSLYIVTHAFICIYNNTI